MRVLNANRSQNLAPPGSNRALELGRVYGYSFALVYKSVESLWPQSSRLISVVSE
jgi:hypothetical protein